MEPDRLLDPLIARFDRALRAVFGSGARLNGPSRAAPEPPIYPSPSAGTRPP